MQIFGNDLHDDHVLCTGQGATSIFFQVDATDPTQGNSFFDWQENAITGNSDVVVDFR